MKLSHVDFHSGKLWRDIHFADLYALNDKSDTELEQIRDLWLKDFLYSQFVFPNVDRADAIFFRSLVRDDYRRLFHSIIEASGVKDFIVIEEYQKRNRPEKLHSKASQFLIDNADIMHYINVDHPIKRACCFIRACKYAFILEQVAKIDFKALICFADMQPVEHLLARYFRAQGKTTITLQHGLYVDYGDIDTVNVINYLHQPSEYFLSWGPNTSALIARNNPGNRTVDCGKPLIFNADAETPDEITQPYVAVMLDQQFFNKENEELLQIAQSFALKTGRAVTVRFHPSIRKDEFFQKFPNIREQLHFTSADLVLGHTSSLIYEALTLGCRVMRYDSGAPGIPLPDICTFQTVEQLEANFTRPQPKNLDREYFTATGAESLERYRAFFRETLPELL